MSAAATDPQQVAGHDADALRMARLGVGVLVVGLGGFLLWALLAPLDQGLVGSGTVVVAGERKTVQTLQGGTIERILVREGEPVTRGQLLVQLNTVQAQSQLDVALGKWLSARSTEARLMAERLDHAAIDWPADLLARRDEPRAGVAMELQQNLFETRRAELANRRQILEHERTALREQLAGYTEIEASFDTQLRYQKEEREGLRKLVGQGYLPRNRLFAAERSVAQLVAQRASTVAEIGRTQQALHENELKVLQETQSFRGDAETQLAAVSAEAASLGDQIEALEFEVESGAIRAPVDGQVLGLAVHTEGGVVPATQRLMEIVPQGSSWVVKAQFPPMMAERLEPGLPVDVRFATLHRVHTPVLAGRVATVSADQIVDEHSGAPYFSVEVEPLPETAERLRDAELEVKPGMQVEVIVKTGERTLANYLMKPLAERLVGAFKEE